MPIGEYPIGEYPVGDVGGPAGETAQASYFLYNGVQYQLSTEPSYPFSKDRDTSIMIVSQAEAGYKQTRARFTRLILSWVLRYKHLTDNDVGLLENLFSATRFTAAFQWYNKQNAQVYVVRFKDVPRISLITYENWETEITLEQV